MSEILAVESTGKGKPTSITNAEGVDISHCFEIRTANVDYFIGMSFWIFCVSTGERPNSYILYILEKIYKIFILAEDGDKGGEMAKLWESSIRQALMPVVHVTGPQGSVSSVKASGEASSIYDFIMIV